MILAVSYVVVGIGFWVTIQLATFSFFNSWSYAGLWFLGWNPADPSWLGILKYGLKLYIVLIPMLAIMGISIGVYTWFFEAKIRIWMTLLKTTGLSLGSALPVIVFLPFVMQGFWGINYYLPYYNYYLILIGFFFMILFVYLAAIVVFSSPWPTRRANEMIRSPMIWILFSGFFVILVMTLGPFVDSLYTESWQYLPPEVYALEWRTGIIITSLPVAFVLPTFPLLFSSSSQYPKLDISRLLAKKV